MARHQHCIRTYLGHDSLAKYYPRYRLQCIRKHTYTSSIVLRSSDLCLANEVTQARNQMYRIRIHVKVAS